MNRRQIILYCVFLSCIMPLQAQWALMRSDADIAVRKGVRHIYNLEYDSAYTEFQKVITAYPEHPVGYFLDAMVDRWRMMTDRRDKVAESNFLTKVEKTISVCNALLQQNEHDIVGLFFKGGIIGFRGRFHVSHNNWIKAASDGKEALDIVMKCAQIAPGNKDILLGLGIYHYFAEAIPEKYPLVKPILAFMPPGDKRTGIEELKVASTQARYAATEARYILLEIYYGFEKNYLEAQQTAEKLVQDYPKNSFFKSYLARCYAYLRNYEKMEMVWREILIDCIEKKTGYDYITAREAMYYIGEALKSRGKYDDALTYFYKCDEFCRKLDQKPSGWMIMLNNHIGNIYDLQGKRDLALSQYKKVLSWDDYFDSHKYAKQFIQRPYGK